jgi:hypothetical protein
MAIRFQFYRKTAADWTSANPVLFAGELGLETDTGKFKFGNGSTAWTGLGYAGASVGTVPWGAISGTLSDQTDLAAALAGKQATLVSATNIKTVNGNSLLGAGDLVISGGGSAAWGGITGTLSAQTDLQTALTARALLAGATFTGAISATNLSGTNTGDQTITLTGDVTGTGTGSFAATIAALAVTSAKIADDAVGNDKLANMAFGTIKARTTAGSGNPENATGTEVTALLDLATTSLKGLAPARSGVATEYLDGTGAYSTPPPTAPAGSTTQIQFNNAGAFGGSADLTFDDSTNRLALAGSDATIDVTGITTEPASPSAGVLRLYTKSIADRMVLKSRGPSGIDTPLQNAFWGNNVVMWTPTGSTGGTWMGSAGTSGGTFANTLPTDTSLSTGIRRGRYANVVTTANQILGIRNTEALFFRGNSNAGAGGFFFFTRVVFDVWTNGSRFFAGFFGTTSVISGDPSAQDDTVGFCIDAADAGAISFLTRRTSATKASTGFTAVTGAGFDLYIFCAPGSSQYSWRIVAINSATEASGTATATLPTNTIKRSVGALASNAALTPADSVQLGVNRIYVETDY